MSDKQGSARSVQIRLPPDELATVIAKAIAEYNDHEFAEKYQGVATYIVNRLLSNATAGR